MEINSTAILVFARSAAEEGSRKLIVNSPRQNTAFFDRLNKRVSSIAKKSGLPYFIIDENQQTGETFGEKITACVSGFFNKGYENLLIIGNDSPGLTRSIVEKALIKITNGHEVLGPDLRGGLYLIGLRKETYNANAFRGFRWQSSFLFQDIKTFYSRSLICTLPSLKDFNTQSDALNAIYDFNFTASLRKLFASCFTFITALQSHYSIPLHECYLFQYLPLRAPPEL